MTDDINVTIGDDDIDVSLSNLAVPTHNATHLAGGADEIDLSELAIDGTLNLDGESITDGTGQTIWDSVGGEVPDSALGTIDNATLANSDVTVAGNSVSLGGSTQVEYTDLADTGISFPIPNTDLSNDTVSVAGNSVSLGGSTQVEYTDLSDTGISFPIPNTDLSNDTVSVAGNSVSLGGSTTVEYTDLADTGISFPIPNTDLANSDVTVTAGDGLAGGGSVSLGGSTTVDVAPGDLTGEYVSVDVNGDLTVDTDDTITSGTIGVDETFAYNWSATQTFSADPAINLSGSRITNAPLPSQNGDVVPKEYVDNSIQGATDVKESVRVSTQSNIDLTSTVDPNPVDGVTLTDGDRVLVQAQTDATENGIYVATTATDPSTWVRSSDTNEDSEFTSGLFTFVEEGSTDGGTSYIVTTEDPISVGTTPITFQQFASAGSISPGDGLDKAGQTLSVDSNDLTGAFISEDGANNLQANIGRGLEGDGADQIRFDEDTAYTFTSDQTFDAGVSVGADITGTGGTIVWDDSVGEVPDSALGTIENATLSNSSVTVSAGDGLKSGGSVSLGGSVTLDTEPADFAGTFLSDDGTDDLQVEIGRGLENDGTGQIQFDEDTAYTFTSALTIDSGGLVFDTDVATHIRDDAGNRRFRITTGNTSIFDDQDNNSLFLSNDLTRFSVQSGKTWDIFDGPLNDPAVQYTPSSDGSSPGTLELTNADLNLRNNNILWDGVEIDSNGGFDLFVDVASNVSFNIDSNNNSTKKSFKVRTDSSTGLFSVDDSGFVNIPNGNLRLGTGQSIEDGSGQNRVELLSSITRLRSSSGVFPRIDLDKGLGVTRIHTGSSGTGFEMFDESGNFDAIKYQTSSTAPGTLRLENADLNLGNNSLKGALDAFFTSTGSSSNVVIEFAGGGGGFYKNSNGDMVAQDENGNDTVLT